MVRCCARPELRVYLKRTGGDHLGESLEDHPVPGYRNKRQAARRVVRNQRQVTQRELRRCYPHGEIKA